MILRCFRMLRLRIPRWIGRILRWRCAVCEGKSYLLTSGGKLQVPCCWCSGGYNVEGPRGFFRKTSSTGCRISTEER